MDPKSPSNSFVPGVLNDGSQVVTVADLAQKQAEFERLLAIQAERRQKEDSLRSEEQRFAIREESLVREAYNLSMSKASFHAEKISWKRTMEDEVRKEEDTRRAIEDARRAIEDDRRKREEQAQMALDADVKQSYEQTVLVDRQEKGRMRRWIEEDCVRALEDVLIRQDVLDLTLHASLPSHVHKHFDSLVGYGATTKQEVDAQVEALLDALLVTQPHNPESSDIQKQHAEPSSLSSSGVLIEPPDAPPSYHTAIFSQPSSESCSVPPSPQVASPSPSTNRSQSLVSVSSASPSAAQASHLQTTPERSRTHSPPRVSYPSLVVPSSPSFSSPNIEVDDFAVLEDEDTPRVEAVAPSLSGPRVPSAGGVEGEEESDFAFDLSIESSRPLGAHDDWEVVLGRGETSSPPSSFASSPSSRPLVVEGATKTHTEFFSSFRAENLKVSVPGHEKQLAKMLSDASLRSLLDPKLSDYNPFSKLVISTRDTWDSCDQCGTYFDRMQIKQTCRTCGKNFCAKCGLITRRLDLSLLTSRVATTAVELRQLFPKTKEECDVEVKCCSACDAALNWTLARDSHQPNQRSRFFQRQYEKHAAAKEAVVRATVQYEELATKTMSARSLPKHSDVEEAETNLNAAFRKYQSCIDSVEQSMATIREELPINPRTGAKFTSSTEIRALLNIKAAMSAFLVEGKQRATHVKIRLTTMQARSTEAASIAAQVVVAQSMQSTVSSPLPKPK